MCVTSEHHQDACARMANPIAKIKRRGIRKAVLSHSRSLWEQVITYRGRGDRQTSGLTPVPSFYSQKMVTATASGVMSAPLTQCLVPRTWATTATSLLPSQVTWEKHIHTKHQVLASTIKWTHITREGGRQVGGNERG